MASLQTYDKYYLEFLKIKVTELDRKIEEVSAPYKAEREEVISFILELEKKLGTPPPTIGTATVANEVSLIDQASQVAKYNWMTVNEIAEKMNSNGQYYELKVLKAKLSAVFAMENKRPRESQRIVRKQNGGVFVYKAKEKAA